MQASCSSGAVYSLCYLILCFWQSRAYAQTADPYEGSLDRSASRGERIAEMSVPGNRPKEIAVLPKHLPFADYRGPAGSIDRADETELVRYDFYQTGTTESNGAVALCPKDKSTSAAVELFEVPGSLSKTGPETAAYCRSIRKSSKDLAKFKQTDNAFTTTSTAAILGYYHVSRALGDICQIEPAVLRTMDIEQHRRMVKMAADLGIRGTVRKSWDLFNRYYTNPRGSPTARSLFTSDFLQIYGALEKNTRGEEHYATWLKVGSNLGATTAFRNAIDPRPINAIVGSSAFTPATVQTLVAMRDMGEMILLDDLMGQSDRLTGGNISDYPTTYYRDAGKIKETRKPAKLPPGTEQVLVKQLTIVDTDAGLLNQNVFEQRGYLSQLCHFHPATFAKLVNLANRWKTDPSVKEFFHEECTFSNSQLGRFEKYLLHAAQTLQTRKESGKLRLDLSLDDYFKSPAPP